MCTTDGTNAYDGPNGIATKDNYLIIARSGIVAFGSIPALVKVPIDLPSDASVLDMSPANTDTESVLDGADGLVFDASNEILYLTTSVGRIIAIRSTFAAAVEWSSGQVVSSFYANCQFNDPSTSTIVPSTGDLIVICTEQFGAGPYAVNRLSGVANNYAATRAFSYDLTFPYMIPESLTYQPSTDSLLYSSYGTGQVYKTMNPSTDISSGFTTTDGSISQIVQFTTGSGALGIQVDQKYDNIVWGAFSPSDGNQGGIFRFDSTTGDVYGVFQLGYLPGSFLNDVSIDNYDGTVYSTNMGLPHLIEATKPNDRTGLKDTSVETTTVAEDVCVDCSSTCDGTGTTCGPNGIAVISNGNKKAKALIAGVFSYTVASNAFFRIGISDGSKTKLKVVPSTFVERLDGIRFDDEGEFLFVASFGTDAVTAYYSCDGWTETMYVAGVFKGGCSDGTNTAVAYTKSGDLVVTCVNGFGPGPYTSTRITNIRSRLLGVSYSSINDFCDGKEPFDLSEDDDEDKDGHHGPHGREVALIVVLVIFGVAAIAFGVLYFKTRNAANSNNFSSSGSPTQSPLGKNNAL